MSSLGYQRSERVRRQLRKDVVLSDLPFSTKAIVFGFLSENRIKEARREFKRAKEAMECTTNN
jgi:hypothetical protein